MAKRLLAVGAAAVAVSAVAVGGFVVLGDDDADRLPGGGPLQASFDGYGPYDVCGSAQPGDRYSFGADFTNEGDEAFTLLDITIDRLDGAELADLVLVVEPTGDNYMVGAVRGYPPRGISRADWATATVPAADADLAVPPGEHVFPVLGLELAEGAAVGHAEDVRVRYEQGGGVYEAVLHDGFHLVADCDTFDYPD